MSSTSRFPSKEIELNAYFNRAIPYLNTNKARLVLTAKSQADLTLVTAALTTAIPNWNTVYGQLQLSASNSSSLVQMKNKLNDDMKAWLREIFNDIPISVLTDTDRDILNLPPAVIDRKPVARPKTAPVVSVRKYGHLTVTLSMSDPEHPQSTAKPDGVDSIQLEGAFIAPGKEIPSGFPQEADFHGIDSVGRSSYERSYESIQLRGTEFIRARYVNSRKEAGPWSDACMIVIA